MTDTAPKTDGQLPKDTHKKLISVAMTYATDGHIQLPIEDPEFEAFFDSVFGPEGIVYSLDTSTKEEFDEALEVAISGFPALDRLTPDNLAGGLEMTEFLIVISGGDPVEQINMGYDTRVLGN